MGSCTVWSTTRSRRSWTPSSPWVTTTCEFFMLSLKKKNKVLSLSPQSVDAIITYNKHLHVLWFVNDWELTLVCLFIFVAWYNSLLSTTNQIQLKLYSRFLFFVRLLMVGPSWVWWWWRNASAAGSLPVSKATLPTHLQALSLTPMSPAQSGMLLSWP